MEDQTMGSDTLLFHRRYHRSRFQSGPIGKLSFKIKSNPLACDMGNHSVGKWDPIPRCGEGGKPQLGEMVECQIVKVFFFFQVLLFYD